MGSLVFLAIVALAIFGAWRWSLDHRSAAVLDKVDSLFTGQLASQEVTFGPDLQQRLYVYENAGGTPRPVLVFFHGGSWNSGSADEYGFIARHFARAGFVVVLAGYRLGKAGQFPSMVEDGASALAWTHAHIAEHGGDPERILLMGHSAGAYIAAMLALDRQWLGREGLGTGFIKGVVCLAGPFDFYPFDTVASRAAFGHYFRPEATQPINFARGDAPPMLLLSGDADTTVRPRNSIALAKALTAAGAPTEPVILPRIGHIGILLRLASPFDLDRRVKRPVLAFLKERAESGAASATVQPPGQ